MRISLSFFTDFIDLATGAELPDPVFDQDFKLSQADLDVDLDSAIADEGVVGGEVLLTKTDCGPTIVVNYWHRCEPPETMLQSLIAYTIAQFEDGIGECGFELTIDGQPQLVYADTAQPPGVGLVEDGRIVLEPPRIAIAARDGDTGGLAAAIREQPREIDRLHQGFSALQLAILFGHRDAVQQLLAAGANPNLVDVLGTSPLEACALSNSLDDEQSREVGQMLLVAGATPFHQTPYGESAKSLAELRRKPRLAAIL